MDKKYLTLLKLALYIVVATHYALFFALVSSIPLLLINEVWYVSIPVVVWIINLMTLPVRCPLTTLENYIRKLAGLPLIKGFVSKHILFRSR